MKIWVDDVRTPPSKEYSWAKSVSAAIEMITAAEKADIDIVLVDLDHDAGDYVNCGGDYIRILDWMERTHRNYPIRLHSANPVGVENMRRIIRKNGWREVV